MKNRLDYPSGDPIEYLKNVARVVNELTDTVDRIQSLDALSVAGLHCDYTTVGNVGSGEDDLMSWSVPGKTLFDDGQYLEFIAWGQTANNANNKTLKAYWDTTPILTIGPAVATDAGWMAHGFILRTSVSTQRISTMFVTSVSAWADNAYIQTSSKDLSAAQVLKFTGTGTSDNDVTQNAMIIRRGPKPRI